MVKTGKFLENAIDLYNILIDCIKFDGKKCNEQCASWTTVGCKIFKIEWEWTLICGIRCLKCIELFGEETSG